MKTAMLASIGCLLLFPCAVYGGMDLAGAITGHISPDDSEVHIIAKLAGTAAEIQGNIKGETTLTKGGYFAITNLPRGKYDIIFQLQGESRNKYMAFRWSEIVVEAGAVVSGINYRLTPRGSKYLIDEVVVSFRGSARTAKEDIKAAGCIIKEASRSFYVVDIPDDKSVDEMITLFKENRNVLYAHPNFIVSALAE